MSTLTTIESKLAAHYFSADRLSRKLLAWAVLLERQCKCEEGFTELQGLGLALRSYSRKLKRMAHSIDSIQVDLTAARKGGQL